MSTCKIGRHLIGLGYKVAAFSFATEGHDDAEPIRLFHASHEGGHLDSRNLNELAEVIRSFQPDVVVNQMPYEHAIGNVLKSKKNYLLLGCLRNTLYSVRGNLESYVSRALPHRLQRLARLKLVQAVFLRIHRRRHRADLLKILDTYDHFVMFGPPNLEELRYFVPEFREEQICLIPNSIPEVAVGIPNKEKRLLWLGRVAHEQKRAELILPIWKIVSKELPDWRLDVVGDGPLLDILRQRVSKIGLKRIEFHGRQVSDDYYRRSAVFFMTSAFEGFPNTLVEAQSYGAIPVVFDSYPVARWIVDDGISGALVMPFDIDAMAQRIVEMARHPDRSRFAEQALESARRFHIDRVGRMWQELFEAEVPKHVKESAPGSTVSH